jgi:mannose-6-phosphate isomerase-like protein (cupin superfamily)
MSMSQAPAAQFARFYQEPPQQTAADGSRTWLTRGTNFVVAYTEAADGAVLARASQPDEYMVYTPRVGATIEAGSQRIEAPADSLTIVPPGDSRVTVQGQGAVIRVFSNRAADLLAACANAAAFREPSQDVAPLQPWPDPPGGFRLRNYRLAEHVTPGSNMRVFRCTNLMLNMLMKREVARDVRKLSPHSHTDFEQGSLAISGTYVHHCRYPWGPDMTDWREDQHEELGSPSLMVVPPKVIHTSRNIGEQAGWLIDVFAPPRVDFSLRPGLVRNADEYPMPQLTEAQRAAAQAARE